MDESAPCFYVDDVVGIWEIAERLDLRADSLAALRGKDGMPEPRGKVGRRVPWWSWEADVVPWALGRGYMVLRENGEGEDGTPVLAGSRRRYEKPVVTDHGVLVDGVPLS